MTSQGPARSWWASLWPALAMAAILVAGWYAYRPALSGTFLLDDFSNLAGLQTVDDTRSALHFVLTGTGGPLGRPLALASFLPQAPEWGRNATPFIMVNIFIHLLNGLLVFLLARQLAEAVLTGRKEILLLAFSSMTLWLFMPLLASSSLLIVQRMTTLSATFVLSGLVLYLTARKRMPARIDIALGGMTAALIGCTLLAMLAKENGVLLPTFVLVIEFVLLKPPRSLPILHWNAWRGIFLVAPTMLVLALLVAQVPYSDELVARREFTAADRVLSQARILWEYLLSAFLPSGAELGPFHESREANAFFSEPLTIVAVIAWIVAIVAAVRWRKRYPVATFAVFWFLAGHLLESTTIPLELYFEHRNYLPVIGPVFALCFFVFRISGRYRVVSRIAFAAYAVVNAGILFGVTSTWGNPLLAATLWHNQDPASVRAATTLASQQLSRFGPETAMETLRDFAGRAPHHAYIRIPELNLACRLAPRQDHSGLVTTLETGLPSVAFSLTTGEMLDQLLTTSVSNQCDSVHPDTIAALATAVMKNPKYSGSAYYTRFHHMLMARIARNSGDTEATLEHLARAIEIDPSDDLNLMTVTTLVEVGRFDEARAFIEQAGRSLSHRPLKRYNSKKYLEGLLRYVNEAERLAGTSIGPVTGE